MAQIELTEIPKVEIEIHARYLLQTIEKYFENPQHKKEYKLWLKEYKKRKQSA